MRLLINLGWDILALISRNFTEMVTRSALRGLYYSDNAIPAICYEKQFEVTAPVPRAIVEAVTRIS